MARYLLDTSLIAGITRPQPPPALVAWLAAQADDDLFISSLTVAVILRRVLALSNDGKRQKLLQWLAGPEGPQALFAGRILPFDERAGMIWARLMAEGSAGRRPRSALDMVLAATAEANGCIIATDKEKVFAGLPIINPTREIGANGG